ncbi:MAG: hypothetical protein AAFU53_13125, partial [Cyanobacteria bacterium J06632_3]
ATIVVLISTAFSGIFSGSKVLIFVDNWLQGLKRPHQLRQATVLVSIVSSVFGCTQTIAILLTEQVMRSHYQTPYSQPISQSPDPPATPTHTQTTHKQTANEQLALALEDTAVIIAPLIPWNIAGLIPATVLSVGPGFIPYSIYLFLLPLLFMQRSMPRSALRI